MLCVNISWSHQPRRPIGDARVFFPSILPAPDAPVVFSANTYVGGTKPVGHSVTRVEIFLDAILEEFTLLDAKTTSTRAAIDSSDIVGDARIAFNLTELIEDGDADKIHQYLQPTQSGLCRWMRVAWETALPFGQLYSTVFHHAFSLQSLQADFAALAGSSTLEDYTTDDIGDECRVQCTDTDKIFALAEVVLAYMAPLFYTSDAALNAALAGPVISIHARVGDPAADTALHDLASVYAGWTRDMDKMVTLDQSFSLNIAASKQPMVDPLTNALIHGDLEELWTDTATPLDS
ncbi:hypothetical protein H310_02562 [Aphanomyces invadans]|uniref:Uncharacterized protein n=1 Tax=Aphanomyces invadans TaxID=157072 RepID=A0A024UIZ7_9STRA|nr:hypothetical protein H310_02562 [Aphanomyces invadans]ETW06269.1 hypothetical protein H310_02562 [Aphanomyces invadans]|eukprot:XP_008864344.1 hypothetical protein H310_02562 [Aphanomyces invadans]